MDWSRFAIPVFGTLGALVLAWLFSLGGKAWANRNEDPKERYRRQKIANTFAVIFVVVVAILLWAKTLQHTSTFLGLIGAGLAVALREPLLSIAGRIAIFTGHIYGVGDRIEINKMSGDVIDIGTFYTRMMEIGNWVGGDQPSGRIVQFSNATIFGTPVFNYTQNFSYIWDEIKIPITYASNIAALTDILMETGSTYTRDFLKEAQSDLEKMKHFFLVPSFDLKPSTFLKVTDNWIEITLRYIVDPKARRAATSFLYKHAFDRIKERDDIQIASSTMDLTLHQPDLKLLTNRDERKATNDDVDSSEAA
jgi:small-conductance mechanosensitive channel